MEPMPAAPHPTKEGWICIPSIHADAAADLREEAAEALRHASETHAQIVQVLPLAPQPPTITTSTTWNPLPHPQEVINYITEAIEEQSGAHEIVKVSVSKRVLDDIVSLLMGMTSSETKPCQLAGLSRCAQSTNALVAQSLEQPELNRQVEGLRSSERTHPHDKVMPVFWYRCGTHGAREAWGPTKPDGDGWIPLFEHPSAIRPCLDGNEQSHAKDVIDRLWMLATLYARDADTPKAMREAAVLLNRVLVRCSDSEAKK
jgi:hypothetical protein